MRSRWRIENLGDYIFEQSIRNPSFKNIEVYSVTNSEGFTKSIDYFSKEVFSKNLSNYKLVKRNQFAYNPSRINVGSIACLTTVDFVLVSPLYIVFEVKRDHLFPDYLLRYMKSNYGSMQIRKNTQGSVRDSLKYKALKKIQVPFPPLDDQIRIAALFSRLDKLIAKRKESIKLLDELLRSIFLEMFGDPVKNEKGWTSETLEKACKEIYRYPTFYGFEYISSGVPVVRISNILQGGELDPETNNYVCISQEISEKYPRTILELNDILMAVRGDGSTGKRIGIVTSKNLVGANISPNLLRFSCNIEILKPKYFFYLITSNSGQNLITRYISRTTKKTITAQNLKAIKIPLPPIELQNQFVTIVEKVEVIKKKYVQSLRGLENFYDSLNQKAFKGELDLSKISVDVVSEPEVTMDEPIAFANPSSINFSEKELIKIIKAMAGQPFSFNELWNKVEQAPFEPAPEYEEIKNMIYTMLKETNPVLKQSFEEVLDESIGERIKKIVLRVTV